VESGKEAWVLEGRDPTYPEVSHAVFHHNCSVISHASLRRAAPRSVLTPDLAPLALFLPVAPTQPRARRGETTIHHRAPSGRKGRHQEDRVRQHHRHLPPPAPTARARNPVPVL
jgi:hypothetical protein